MYRPYPNLYQVQEPSSLPRPVLYESVNIQEVVLHLLRPEYTCIKRLHGRYYGRHADYDDSCIHKAPNVQVPDNYN